MTENDNFKFKVGDKVVKENDPTVYTIKAVYLVKPVYYEAQGELGNIVYLPENKISLVSKKYHDEIVSDGANYNLDSSNCDQICDAFKAENKKDNEDEEITIESLKRDLREVVEMRKNYAAMEKFIRCKIAELEAINLQKTLNEAGVTRK